MKLPLLAALAIALAGCAAPSRPALTIQAPVESQVAARMLEKGRNTIRGSALVRQRGGGVVTCAGGLVSLIPATKYAVERMSAAYGPGDRGYNPVGPSGSRVEFANTPAEYLSLQRTAQCDALGAFRFEQVADGEFFVVTMVTWETTSSQEGGSLMARVLLKGGESRDVVLAPSYAP